MLQAYFVFSVGNLKVCPDALTRGVHGATARVQHTDANFLNCLYYRDLQPIWSEEYPKCWVLFTTCSPELTHTISYTQVSGIIFGQLFLGFAADSIGRKWGSILCAGTMLFFGILMTASYGTSDGALFAFFTAMQFLFGVGVGGG